MERSKQDIASVYQDWAQSAVERLKKTACTSLPSVWSNASGGKAEFAFISPARKRSLRKITMTKSREIPL